ncbi:MAG: type II toxin-antitoxin system VapC family toxin [Novosphingobium sp.]
MFLDASAMVAMMTAEPEQAALAAQLAATPIRFTSAIAIWETTVRIMSKTARSNDEANRFVDQFLTMSQVLIIPVGPAEAELAVSSYARYGKRRHSANLNMGDCFAYACAKANAVPLLYIGNDFSQTDVNDGFE